MLQLKAILKISISSIIIYFCFKFCVLFMAPFFLAVLICIIIEPIIKTLMDKLRLNRTPSIFVALLFFMW